MVFHWLSCGSFSLAGPLPGEEKIFLPPVGVAKLASSCWKMQGALLSVVSAMELVGQENAK